MKPFWIHRPRKVALVALLSFALGGHPAFAERPLRIPNKSPVKLQKWMGMIDLEAEGPLPFALEGTASHLGKFEAHGEVEFVCGEEEGTFVGLGVVVFEAANGDLLVGNVQWELDEEVDGLRTSAIHFSWADSIEFSDGTIFESTGRFEDDRPPGLVVIAIIAILIGLLVPAVQ